MIIYLFARYATFGEIGRIEAKLLGRRGTISASGREDNGSRFTKEPDTSSTAVAIDVTRDIGGERRQSHIPAVERRHVHATCYA